MRKISVALLLCSCIGLGRIVMASPLDSSLQEVKKATPEGMTFFASGQIWLRHTELNPGSQVEGAYESSISDISIRRFRMGVTGDINDKVFVKIQMGLNNLNYLTRDAQIKLLDLLAVYKFSDRLHLGIGKNGYTGPSRYASVASFSAMGVDIPIFALSTINIEDDYLRKFSLFAKGNIGQLGYRMVLAKPSKPLGVAGIDEAINFHPGNPKWQVSGYFKYQFFEKETLRTAYMPGTYYGKKSVLNIGIGFLSQDRATWNLEAADTSYYQLNQWAVDLFLDLPLNANNSQSLTVYTSFFHTDFGPNYVRMIGANNPALQSDGRVLNGGGNRYPSIGTGNIFYSQIGYRMALKKEGFTIKAIQPYASIQYADYDGLGDVMSLYELGANVLFNGHKSKLTFGWQSRPIYNIDTQRKMTERKSMYVLQYQFKI